MHTLTNTDGFPGILGALTLAGVLTSLAWVLVTL